MNRNNVIIVAMLACFSFGLALFCGEVVDNQNEKPTLREVCDYNSVLEEPPCEYKVITNFPTHKHSLTAFAGEHPSVSGIIGLLLMGVFGAISLSGGFAAKKEENSLPKATAEEQE